MSAAPSFISAERGPRRHSPLKLGKTGRGRLGVNSWLFSDDAFEAPDLQGVFRPDLAKSGGLTDDGRIGNLLGKMGAFGARWTTPRACVSEHTMK